MDLSQYNKAEHPGLSKFFAILLFILEFIIILPIVVFFWFAVITLMMVFLVSEQSVERIILMSAAIVGVIRMAAYYNEELSVEIAKLLPFTILAVALMTPGFFNLKIIFERIYLLIDYSIIFYLFAIMVLEFVLRIFYIILSNPD